MALNVGIVGLENSGKSYSRTTILDGEHVFLLNPSRKQSYLKKSDGTAVGTFDLRTASYDSFQKAIKAQGAPNAEALIKLWTKQLPEGTFQASNFLNTSWLIKNMNSLTVWGDFISKHMHHIHTIIVPDFTHSISRVLADTEFIERKTGGDAYQKFWELAAEALQNFIIKVENYREDLIVVTEFHAEYDDQLQGYGLYVPGGKMIKEKFKIFSYYDIMVHTHVERKNEGTRDESATYEFVTKPTKLYPNARTMGMFDQTFIPNDLNLLLTKVREHMQMKPMSEFK